MRTALQDARAEAVLERLYALDRSQAKLFKARGRRARIRHWFGRRWDAAENDLFLRDKLLSLHHADRQGRPGAFGTGRMIRNQ